MDESERIANPRSDRLAEMVWHLTDCHPLQAVTAVGEAEPDEDALLVVARAMCHIRDLDLRDKLDLRDSKTARDGRTAARSVAPPRR